MDNVNLLVEYARDQQRRNLARNSINRNRITLRSLARYHGDRPLLELGKDDIDAWLDAVHREPRSRYAMISVAATFYEWAIGRELLDVNPTRRIVRPKLHRSLPRPISHDDLSIAVHVPMIRA